MPLYDYICKVCEVCEEKLLNRSQLDTPVICERCNTVMQRLVSAVDYKIAGAPPKHWRPLPKSRPKSEVRNIHEIRRVEKTD